MNQLLQNKRQEYDINYFDKNLQRYDIKPIKTIFENIGGICENNKFDCSKINDQIAIEHFYVLPNDLRYKILKHIFVSDTICAGWGLHMTNEMQNKPYDLISYCSFPRYYKLEYTMNDKSRDIVIKEILLNLEQNNTITEETVIQKTKKKSSKKTKDNTVIEDNTIKIIKPSNKTKNKKDIINQDNTIIENIKPKKKSIPPSLKIKVWNKHIGDEIGKTKCLCCKLQDIYQASFSCGHIISEFNGGELKLDNLKPICSSCNSSMSTKNMNEYITEYGF